MSYDFDTALTPCEHLVKKERMSLDKDWKTLVYYYNPTFYMRATINGEDSVRVYVDGVNVPKNHPEWGWDIIVDPDTRDATFVEKRKRIQFHTRKRMVDTLIEIDYRTIQAHCRRCQGSGKAHDFKRSQTNGFLHTWDTPKLMLKVSKFLLTSECSYYPAFTCKIRDWVGDKISSSMAEEDISMAISSSLSNLKRIQLAQKNFQDLTPQEILRDIGGVSVYQDQNDPSKLITSVSIVSYGGSEPTPLTFTMRNNS